MLSVLVALVVVGVVVIQHRPAASVLPGQGSGRGEPSADGNPDGEDTRTDAAGRLLGRLTDRLEHGTRRQVTALAANPRAARELAVLRNNVRALRVSNLSLRYLDEDAGRLGAARQRALGGDAWVGDVQLRWRLAGFDLHDSLTQVKLTFAGSGDRARFVTARHTDGRATPLWLMGRVSVDRTSRSLTVTAGARPPVRLSGLADRAVLDVRKVLPAWRGRLVVEVPSDQDELTRALGAEPGAYSEIAAVTTTTDGSVRRSAPVHIFVNPRVFDPLGPHGSQIVMSHEATHVATGAAVSELPTWLLEGFADYVALDHVDLPVSVTASQILAAVRRSGAPAHLPGRREFDPHNVALGASYESAWLACRLLGERYGERRLIAFYRASDRASSTTAAFRRVLGTDQQAFTRAWRADLGRLAG